MRNIESAYIHIPFCSHKCEFCDFAAVANMSHLEDEYTETVIKEMEARLKLITAPIKLSSIFFGGGTPGLVSTKNIERIIRALKQQVEFEDDLEFSLETTPQAITPDKVRQWRDLGVNRLSIGIESWQDSELSAIGRDHSAGQALEGLEKAAAGFDNINIDFMYGLPTQTLESWTRTLDEIVRLSGQFPQIKHVSAYSLEIAVNAPLLVRFPLSSTSYPDEDSIAAFFEILLEKLKEAGYMHYEVSNFAKPGYLCRHNLVYWNNKPYLAFGVGAHRYVNGVRSSNFRSLMRYMRDFKEDEMSEAIDAQTRLREALMLGLRMRAGIDVRSFFDDYGVDLLNAYAKIIDKFVSLGLMELKGTNLRISDRGVLLSNSILAEFI